MLGLLNTVLSRGGSLLTYVKDGLVMANRFLTPPKLTFPVDASAEFNGTSDYIDTGIDIDTTQPMTFGAWVYQDNNSTARAIIGDGYPSANEAAFSLITIQSSSNLFISYGSSSINAANLLPSLNQWFYLSVTFDSGNINAFINGSKLYNGSYNNAYPQHNRSQFLGARRSQSSPYDAIQFLDGNLANVAIWNRALSSDEINSVMWKTYEQVSTTESNGLQAWYKLSADEVLSGDSTATLEKYAEVNSLTFEAPACVQTALNGLPDITDARLYSANYDIRVKADGGTVESLSCVETELNAIL
jgi:hypothetical protein